MKGLTTNLWFDKQAEEAVTFYTSIFPEATVGAITRFGKEGQEVHGMPEGTVMTIEFRLNGMDFVALNGGPHFKFNESISFIVNCENQEEVDYYWNKLTEGGNDKAQMCGWLKDRYGLSWQVVPVILNDMIMDKDRVKAGRAMNAMLKMKKLDIKKLEDAFNGVE